MQNRFKLRLCSLLALWLTLFIPVGHANDYERGMQALENGDVATALGLWRPLAESGNAPAQFALGALYNDALGVAQDYAEANYWFLRAAEQGYAMAQFNLGNAYREGTGMAVDPVMAVIWWRKAAEQGFSPAQFNLGSAYLEGFGIPRDQAAAITWYRRAAANGHAQAASNLQELEGASAAAGSNTAAATPAATVPTPPPVTPRVKPEQRPDQRAEKIEPPVTTAAVAAAPASDQTATQTPIQTSVQSNGQSTPQAIPRKAAPAAQQARQETRTVNNPPAPALAAKSLSAGCRALLEQQSHTHTVQLMVSQSKARLSAYVAEHKLPQTTICNYSVDGKAWNVLLYGRYASADAARAALDKLPDAVRVNGGYVRRISVITRAVSKTP